jgi:penicillin-binding protein 1C
VWVGSFDGTPHEGISGSEHAAPLLFELFRALEPGGVAPVRPFGLQLDTIELCTLSHQLPGPFCPETRRYPYLPGRSRLETCSLHRRVPVDPETGGLVTADCGPRPFDWRRVTVYPAELVAWQRASHRTGEIAPGLPPVSPRCPGSAGGLGGRSGEPPRIVSPDAATPYRLRRDAPLAFQRIALVARTGADARRLYWYQDGLLVGSAAVGQPLFLTPTRGRHRLAVTDDQGRTDGMSYEVE